MPFIPLLYINIYIYKDKHNEGKASRLFSLQLKPQNQTKQKSKNYILKVHPVSSLATRISVVQFRACQQQVLRFTINAYVSILAKHVGLDCLQARIYQVQLPRCVYLTLWMDNIMNFGTRPAIKTREV